MGSADEPLDTSPCRLLGRVTELLLVVVPVRLVLDKGKHRGGMPLVVNRGDSRLVVLHPVIALREAHLVQKLVIEEQLAAECAHEEDRCFAELCVEAEPRCDEVVDAVFERGERDEQMFIVRRRLGIKARSGQNANLVPLVDPEIGENGPKSFFSDLGPSKTPEN